MFRLQVRWWQRSDALARPIVYALVHSAVDRIAGILHGENPIALVPADSQDRAKQIAVAARDGGFGVSVIEDRSLVLVVGDHDRQADLRRFGAEIATDRHVKIETVYCPAGWLTAMAYSRGANVGSTL